MTIRLPPPVKAALDKAAAESGQSAAAIVAASLVQTLGIKEPLTEDDRLHRELRAKHQPRANTTAVVIACSASKLEQTRFIRVRSGRPGASIDRPS